MPAKDDENKKTDLAPPEPPQNELLNDSPEPAGKPFFTRIQTLTGFALTSIISVAVAVIITAFVIPLGQTLDQPTGKTVIQAGKTDNLIAAVARKVTPSVVTIQVFQDKSGLFEFPFAEHEQQTQKPDAIGSGVIYREDGYIITNNHVVENAKKVVVIIGSSKKATGKVVAGDAQEDIAVIKVDKDNLPAADIGSSSKLDVGDLAVAIGSPFELQHTVTSGIISAKNRVTEQTDFNSPTKTLTDMIQTDAAINPGNSGGALANARGQVIGINSLIKTTTGEYSGIGFAIPIERAKSIADQLISKGKASHPYIGVSIVDTKNVQLPGLPEGVFVQDVMVGGPAYKADIKAGDVITKLNGQRVTDGDKFIAIIKRGKVGSKVTLTYVRNKVTKETAIVLAEKPSNLE